jgi:hypothetical protein
MLLGLAGGLDGPLDQPRRPLLSVRLKPLDLQVDLLCPLGEQPDQLLGQALELAVAVPVGRRPLHAHGPDKLPLVGGPVDGVSGQPMPIQVPTVQRRPTSVQPLDAVGHDQVGVHQWVTLSGRPMIEPDRQHPLSIHVLDTAMAAPGAEVSVQVGDRLADTGVMSREHRPAGGRITQAVEDRDALGWAQHHVKGRHRVATMRAAEELAGVGVAALEHPLEPRRRCFAFQPECAGAGAVPAARGLPVAGQVRLVVGGQLAGVILLPPNR